MEEEGSATMAMSVSVEASVCGQSRHLSEDFAHLTCVDIFSFSGNDQRLCNVDVAWGKGAGIGIKAC